MHKRGSCRGRPGAGCCAKRAERAKEIRACELYPQCIRTYGSPGSLSVRIPKKRRDGTCCLCAGQAYFKYVSSINVSSINVLKLYGSSVSNQRCPRMDAMTRIGVLVAGVLLLVSCFPEMTQTSSGTRVPKLSEYNLNPSRFDYQNDDIDSGSIYVSSVREDERGFIGNALVFNEQGGFKEIGVESRTPTANEVNHAPAYRYGLYGVKGNDVIIESYSRPDGFYREIGYIRGDSLCLTGSDLGRLSPFQPFNSEVCHVRTPVEFLDQIPFVYPGQSMLE